MKKSSGGRWSRRESSGFSCRWFRREFGSNRRSFGGNCKNYRGRSSRRKLRGLVRVFWSFVFFVYLGWKYFYFIVGVYLYFFRVIFILGFSV